MSIKLFVTDLDGTLLPTGVEVPARNAQAVRDMAAAGVIVTLATGRMYRAALPIAHSLAVDVPLITYNGALIKSAAGEVIHEDCLASELALKVIDFCQARDWHVQTYSDDQLRYAERNDLAEAYERAVHVVGTAVGRAALRKFSDRMYKLLLVTHGLDESDLAIDLLRAEFGDRIDTAKSQPHYVEITARGVSKAAALRLLAARYGISLDETMAIGDSGNDISMIRAAGIGVAMGNASDDVKAVCKYVTSSCAEDGFAEAAYRYVLDR